MEEDIKILEDFIKYFEAEAISIKYRRNISITVGEDDIQAIENLIKGYRKSEMENQSYRDYLGEPPCYDNASYIPKSKIKEMIEEKQKRIDKMHPASECVLIDDLENQIEVLQELIKEAQWES